MTLGWRQAIIDGCSANTIRLVLTRDGTRRTNFHIAEHPDGPNGEHDHVHVIYYESSGNTLLLVITNL